MKSLLTQLAILFCFAENTFTLDMLVFLFSPFYIQMLVLITFQVLLMILL